jgi:hypothetical protein
MKKSTLVLCTLLLTTTAPQTHALAWKNVAPYAIGIPVGLAASGFSLCSNSYAKTTFLKKAGKLSIYAFGLCNTSLCILSGIAAAWYLAKKTNKHEDCATQEHIAEKTIDIAGLTSILGLIGYYVHKASPYATSVEPNNHKCPYLSLKGKSPTLPQLPSLAVNVEGEIPLLM